MAKRRKKTTTHRRKSSRRGGLHGFGGGMKNLTPVLIQVAEGVGGAIVASYATNKFLGDVGKGDANNPKGQPNLKHLIVLGAGAAATMFVSNPHVKAIGVGVASYAGLQLAKSAIPGLGDLMIGEVDAIMENLMIGAADDSYPLIEEDVVIDEDTTIIGNDNY